MNGQGSSQPESGQPASVELLERVARAQTEERGRSEEVMEREQNADDGTLSGEEEEDSDGHVEFVLDDQEETVPIGLITLLLGTRATQTPQSRLSSYTKLKDVVILPLKGELAHEVNLRTSVVNRRQPCDAPSLDQGVDAGSRRVSHPGPRVAGVQEQGLLLLPTQATPAIPQAVDQGEAVAAPSHDPDRQQDSGSIHHPGGSQAGSSNSGACQTRAVGTRSSSRLRAQKEKQQASASSGAGGGQGCPAGGRTAGKTPASARGRSGAPSGPEPDTAPQGPADGCPRLPLDASGWVLPNTARILSKRECGLGDAGGFSRASCRHMQCRPGNLPTKPVRQVDHLNSRAYIGQFSDLGRFFVAAYQDKRVRLYDVENDWELRKDVRARGIRWTITDTCLSPDQRFLLYSSISPTVHLLALGGSWDVVESLANVTEVHEALEFDPSGHDRFGIWSLAWSGDGREIIAGTNNDSVYIYDVATSTVFARVTGHRDDVNAVTYLDSTPNLILSGSDDSNIKLWDRRLVSNEPGGRSKPVGTMVGHTEGITYLNSRGDGRHFISNSKDQCVKLWDARVSMRSDAMLAALPRAHVPSFNWDYRWMDYPAHGYDIRHPYDASLMTYRGHQVHQTLIRAYFSPSFSTGQRFIYAGSANGCIYIWDVVTGKRLHQLKHHRGLVRDVGWHPYEPMLGSVSWDGCAMLWEPQNLHRP